MKNKITTTKHKIFWITWVSVLVLVLTAFGLLKLGFIDYGVTLFCILPACIGILTRVMADFRKAILGALAALFVFILLLAFGGAEGIVCIIMALPVVAFFIFIGYLISLIIKHFIRRDSNLKLSFVPFCVFLLAAGIESIWQGTSVYDKVTTTAVLHYPTSLVYDNIKQVDTVVASPGWLHILGLPYPRKCVMTAEREGGLRICKFDNGTIVETITSLKRNELLEMDVTQFNLPGQNWFEFKKDIYEISEMNRSTIISRTTTYTSSLKPRMYWKWVEKITIGAEQELVFKNLEDELAAKEY